jgi:hypothetical protein
MRSTVLSLQFMFPDSYNTLIWFAFSNLFGFMEWQVDEMTLHRLDLFNKVQHTILQSLKLKLQEKKSL